METLSGGILGINVRLEQVTVCFDGLHLQDLGQDDWKIFKEVEPTITLTNTINEIFIFIITPIK
jgi:hypothetical protein